MEQQYILTLEELGFSLAFCGYDEMAAGMLKENLGEISEESWEMVFQTASRSLYSKGILLNLYEEDANQSFIFGFKDLVDDLANSNYMIRCYNETEYGQFVLIIHQGKNGFVYHLIINQIIHVLNYVKDENLVEAITAFFHPVFSHDETEIAVSCSEEDFECLKGILQTDSELESLIDKNPSLAKILPELELIIDDSKRQGGNLVNISLIHTDEKVLPILEEVYLLLIAPERTWTIFNSNSDKNQEPKLMIQTLNEVKWRQMINDFISSMKGRVNL